jgi:AcrR family transcriptional regulator
VARGVLVGVHPGRRDDGDDVDHDTVRGFDDEVALAELLGAKRQQLGQARLSDKASVLLVDVVDLEVEDQATPYRNPVPLGERRVVGVEKRELVLRRVGPVQAHVPVGGEGRFEAEVAGVEVVRGGDVTGGDHRVEAVEGGRHGRSPFQFHIPRVREGDVNIPGVCEKEVVMTRAAQREATRRALLAEGRRHFAADGYEDVVLAAVAQAIGATKGAAYHHFGSKLGLFRAVVAEVQDELSARVAAAADAAEEPWEQLRAGCRTFLESGTDPDVRRILLEDAPAVLGWNEWLAMDEASSAGHLAEGLAELMAAGVIVEQPVEPLTRLLSGAMNETALWIARSDDKAALDQAVAALDRLLAGIRA